MTFIRLCSTLLLLALAAAGATAVLVIDAQPLVTESSTLTATELRKARQLVRDMLSASRNTGSRAMLSVNEADTEVLLAQVLDHLLGGDADVEYGSGSLRLRVTAVVPPSILGRYANLDITLLQLSDQLVLDRFRLGNLQVPGWLADLLLQFGHTELQEQLPEYAMLLKSIDSFAFSEDLLELAYTLTPETLGQLSAKGSELLLTPETSERLQAHATFLATLEAELAPSLDSRNNISLAQVLGPMFRFAGNRGGDAAEENRAALLVLALHQMDMNPARLLQGTVPPNASDRRARFTLYQRRDYAQHFLGSAVLAVSVEPGLADTIALLKELDDSQEGGSGFSFTDLAADMGGIRFGEAAVADTARAPRVQALMGNNQAEEFFMLDVRGLPEFLSEEEFSSSYGTADSQAYKAVESYIERGIATTPLYHAIGN
jgi:hypothetical protein